MSLNPHTHKSRLREVSQLQKQEDARHRMSSSTSTASASIWSRMISSVPHIRNTTHLYAHDAVIGATEVMGQLASHMQKRADSLHQPKEKKESKNSQGPSAVNALPSQKQPSTNASRGIGFSRLAFRYDDEDNDANSQSLPPKKSASTNTVEGTNRRKYNVYDEEEMVDENEADLTSRGAVVGNSGGLTRSNAVAAAAVASKATTQALSNFATGVYNLLKDANVPPETRYNPGEALYGSSPPSAAVYANSVLSPSSASLLSPFIPPFGHINTFHDASTISKINPSKPNQAHSSPNNKNNVPPPSLAVIAASVQTVAAVGTSSNLSAQSACPTTSPIQTNYLSLAYEDGLAIFEVDDSGVYEVIAHVTGDAVLKHLFLRHSLLEEEEAMRRRSAQLGAPPQPTPKYLLDVKVLETATATCQHSMTRDSGDDDLIVECEELLLDTPADGATSEENPNSLANAPTEDASPSSSKSLRCRFKKVTLTSQTPLVTMAVLTDTFLHYKMSVIGKDADHEDALCEQHQRVMIVECVPQCVIIGGDDPSCDRDGSSGSNNKLKPVNTHLDDEENNHAKIEEVLQTKLANGGRKRLPAEFFVPLPAESPQQLSLSSQVLGLPFFPFIHGKVKIATAGLLYRVVSYKTFVDRTRMTSLSIMKSLLYTEHEKSTPLDTEGKHGQGYFSYVSGLLGVLSEPLGTLEGYPSQIKKQMTLLSYAIPISRMRSSRTALLSGETVASDERNLRQMRPNEMKVVRTVDVANGSHAYSQQWLAFAGASPLVKQHVLSDESLSLPGNDTQTILRSEQEQTNTEFFAKAATTKLGMFGALFGRKEKEQSPGAVYDIANFDGSVEKSPYSADTHNETEQQKGVITVCDVSLMVSRHKIDDDCASSAAPFSPVHHHDFASFAAHSNPVQHLAFDKSGTLLATASTSGTSVNVYQITKTRQQRAGGRFEVDHREYGKCSDATGKSVPLLNPHNNPAYVGEVILLYRLLRGTTSAVVTSVAFSPLSLSLAVATSLGTCHFYILDHHYSVKRESVDQLNYRKQLQGSTNGYVAPSDLEESDPEDSGPFPCYRVGIRGELSALRRAPLTAPVCRARSVSSTPAPWPLLTFRPLAPYRNRSFVGTLGKHARSTLHINVATFNCIVLCPASLSVTCIQYNELGDSSVLYTTALPSFRGAKWLQDVDKTAHVRYPSRQNQFGGRRTTTDGGKKRNVEATQTLTYEDVMWLMAQERHCAASADYSWAHLSSFTHAPRRGTPSLLSGDPSATSVCDWGIIDVGEQLRQEDRYYSLLNCPDDVEADYIASELFEDDTWDVAQHDDLGDISETGEDFVVA